MAEGLRAPHSNSGVSDQQSVGSNPSAVTLASLSRTLSHFFVLQMGRKAVGPVCCVTHVKRTECTYQKEKGFTPVFLAMAAEC